MENPKPATPGTHEAQRGNVAGTARSGKLVVIVFVLCAAGLIGGSAALLRWAKNKSYESLVHPPGVAAPPASGAPSGGSSSAAPQIPPKP